MSADNWQVCPRCKRKEEKRVEAMEIAAGKNYGHVESQAFIDSLAKAREAIANMKETFREDYEQGVIDNGEEGVEYFLSYHGSCQVCDFSHDYKHSEELKP